MRALLAHHMQALVAVQAEREAGAAQFEDMLIQCRTACAESALQAKQESMAPLKGEMSEIKVSAQVCIRWRQWRGWGSGGGGLLAGA